MSLARLSALIAAAGILSAGLQGPAVAGGDGLMGGGAVAPRAECVTAELRAALSSAVGKQPLDVQVRSDANPRRQTTAATHGPGFLEAVPRYAFYPMAGDLHGDIFNGGFVDLDPGPEFIDFDCAPFTYNGHAGIDTEIRSFGEQDVGVPVYAVLPGRVIFAQDGWPDKNVNGGEQGNIVGIDHGQGRATWYYHLKKNSVAVALDEPVAAGRQIAMVGSSGNSFGPHLHFESQDAGVPVEVFAGPCRPGESGWENQAPLHNNDLYLTDFATTEVDLENVPGLPFEMPRSGQIGLDDPYIRFWLKGVNLPVESNWRVRFYQPDGSVAEDSNWFFFNEEVWRTYWFWWEYDIPDMHTTTGTWHILVEFNDREMIRAPIEVRPTRTPEFNRPPRPITAYMDPPAPRVEDAVFCRVDSEVLLDDLDYDIVRYHYVWKVGNVVVRDVVTAGHSDAIAAGTVRTDEVVVCTVTPNDGRVDGTGDEASARVGAKGDLDGDRDIDLDDYAEFAKCLNGPGNPPAPACSPNVNASFDDDEDVDLRDYAMFARNVTRSRR